MPAIASTFDRHVTAEGGYWTSPPPRRGTLPDLRRALQEKLADAGADNEASFEQAFSSLAYTFIKDKAPRLLDFIVGFQLLERNDDNTKAVGIFGFKVGDQWMYVPVFFLNGELKGADMIWLKNQKNFVPLKENWVNYLIARRPHILGKPSVRNTQELGGLMPNLLRLTHPPTGTKYGADSAGGGDLPHIDRWAHGFLPLAGMAQTQARQLLAKSAAALQRLDLRTALLDPVLLQAAYHHGYRAYPAVKAGFDRFYGRDFFATMARRLQSQELLKRASAAHDAAQPAPALEPAARIFRKRAAAVDPVQGDRLQVIVRDPLSGQPRRLAKRAGGGDAGDLAVDRSTSAVNDSAAIAVNLPELTDAEREKLVRDTVLIRDDRDPHAVPMVYNTQVRMQVANPTETGVYAVLERPGKFADMLVVLHPCTSRGTENYATVVRTEDPRSWLNTHPTNLFVKETEAGARPAYADYFDGLKGVETLEEGGTYVALTAAGAGTCPFRVREDYGDGSYRVAWQDHCEYGKDRPAFLPAYGPRHSYDAHYASYDAKVRVAPAPSGKLRSLDSELRVPSSAKIVKVADPPRPKRGPQPGMLSFTGPDAVDADSSDPPVKIEPGDLAHVQLFLHEKAAAAGLERIRLLAAGDDDFWIRRAGVQERLSKRAALVSLVRDHGLRESDARLMLKAAAAGAVDHRAVEYYISRDARPHLKQADPVSGDGTLQPGPGAPAFPPPWQGMEQVGPKMFPAIYPQEEFHPVPELDSGLTDPTIYDPFYRPDQNMMQVAQQAAGSGQKEVFDTAMFSGLLKSMGQGTQIDRGLGDLITALDRLGTYRFLFYWHQEEFADRFGQDDLPELEDGLRNAFDSLGDIVLYLRERNVQTGYKLDPGSGQADSAAGPDITEAARN